MGPVGSVNRFRTVPSYLTALCNLIAYHQNADINSSLKLYELSCLAKDSVYKYRSFAALFNITETKRHAILRIPGEETYYLCIIPFIQMIRNRNRVILSNG